jgi:hypothetical protein
MRPRGATVDFHPRSRNVRANRSLAIGFRTRRASGPFAHRFYALGQPYQPHNGVAPGPSRLGDLEPPFAQQNVGDGTPAFSNETAKPCGA